jgi:hypothetical protein
MIVASFLCTSKMTWGDYYIDCISIGAETLRFNHYFLEEWLYNYFWSS